MNSGFNKTPARRSFAWLAGTGAVSALAMTSVWRVPSASAGIILPVATAPRGRTPVSATTSVKNPTRVSGAIRTSGPSTVTQASGAPGASSVSGASNDNLRGSFAGLEVLFGTTANEAAFATIRYSPDPGLELIFSPLYPVK